MQLQITAHNLDLTDKIKKTIDAKFSQKIDLLLKTFDAELKIATMHLERQKFEGGNYKINFDINLPGKEHIFSENIHKDLVSAITGLREKVEKQVKKYKDEISAHPAG